MHLYFKMQHLSYNIFVLGLTMKPPEYATRATLAHIRGKISRDNMSLYCPRIVPPLRESTDSQNMFLHTALGGGGGGYLQQILLGQMLLSKFRLREYEGIGLYPWGYYIFCVKLENFCTKENSLCQFPLCQGKHS